MSAKDLLLEHLWTAHNDMNPEPDEDMSKNQLVRAHGALHSQGRADHEHPYKADLEARIRGAYPKEDAS